MKTYVTSGQGYVSRLETVRSGFEPGQTFCWVHARAGAIPSAFTKTHRKTPSVVMTMQQLDLKGSDVFEALHEIRTDDLGATWSEPVKHETLGRKAEDPSGLQIGICDFTPAWHKRTQKLLGTGHTVAYKEGDTGPREHKRKVGYSVYEPGSRTWSNWKAMMLPPELSSAGAGSSQRVDLEDGTILLPVYFKKPNAPYFYSTVLKCMFDGTALQYISHGSEHTMSSGRGYYEPSLTRFAGRFFMTLRADDYGFITSSHDGLQFDEPQVWRWDDGTVVPTYNTQQHWVTHHERLFLVYTRKSEDNDHVFRHRAPLFMAEVDPETLRLNKQSERVLIPERGARLGNFSVVHVNEYETWVTVSEWMQNGGPWGEEMWKKLYQTYPMEDVSPLKDTPYMSGAIAKYGADNAVFIARIQWEQPNQVY